MRRKDREESLKQRGKLIVESFKEQFNKIKRIDEDRVNKSGYVPPKERQTRTNPITGYDIDSDEFGSTINNPSDSSGYVKPDYDTFRGKQNRTWIDTRNEEIGENDIGNGSPLNEGTSINDFFDFLAKDPKKGTINTVYYTSPVGMNKFMKTPDGKRGEVNPMAGKVFKNSTFNFRWEDTYQRAVERTNPEHEFGKRSGTFEKVEGYEVLETGKNGIYLPIIPTNIGNSSKGYLYKEDNGAAKDISIEEIKPYLKPPSSYSPASGTNFRLLMVDRISKINAGGNTWENPHFYLK